MVYMVRQVTEETWIHGV